jgi:hypothetical protein
MKNGFHEDGLASAIDVVNAMAERDRMVAAAFWVAQGFGPDPLAGAEIMDQGRALSSAP